MAVIDIPFKLHKAQREIFNNPKRFRVCVNGRRFGKTALGITELIIRGLSYTGTVDPKFPVTVLGVLPTANQARKIIWEPLRAICDSKDFRVVIRDINRTQMTVTLINGVVIRVVGANDNGGDRLRGLKCFFVWFDETQDIKPVAFSEAVRPAMSDTVGSRALFTGTPKGKQNWLYDLSLKPQQDSDWQFFNFPTWANPTIPRDEVENARLTLPPRLFAQEYTADFVDFPGKFYTELDINNKFYGEISRFDLVVMGVDWGDLHPALSVIGRGVDRNWYWVEGWSPNQGKDPQVIPRGTFEHHIKRLVHKWGVNLTFADPSRPSDILWMRSLGAAKGFTSTQEGYNRIIEGITQVHNLITQNRLLFVPGLADKVPDSIDGDLAYSLHEAYHRTTDKNGNFTDVPTDGYFSHIVDSTRYALATKVG